MIAILLTIIPGALGLLSLLLAVFLLLPRSTRDDAKTLGLAGLTLISGALGPWYVARPVSYLSPPDWAGLPIWLACMLFSGALVWRLGSRFIVRKRA